MSSIIQPFSRRIAHSSSATLGIALLLGCGMSIASAEDVAANMTAPASLASLETGRRQPLPALVEPAAVSSLTEPIPGSEARKHWIQCLRGWHGVGGCIMGKAIFEHVVTRSCTNLEQSTLEALQATCPAGTHYHVTAYGVCGQGTTGPGCVPNHQIPK
jgi:hypothetical protein